MEFTVLTLLLSALSSALVYLYLVWNFNIWKKRGIDGPKPHPLYGNTPSLITQKRNIAFDIDDIYREYKDKERFVGIFMFRSPWLLITDPALVREIEIENFSSFHKNDFSFLFDPKSEPLISRNPAILSGEDWREKRAEFSQALTTNKIKATYNVMQTVAVRMTKFLEKVTESKPKDGIDAKDLGERFSIDIVGNCVYGLDAGTFSNETSEMLEMGKNITNLTLKQKLYFVLVRMAPIIRKVYSMSFINPRTTQFLKDVLKEAIDFRGKNQDNRADFLNYLLELRDKKNLTHEQMTGFTSSFYVDGFAASSVAISNALFLLGKHKDIQNRLRAEINEEIAENGELSFEKLNSLTYLDQCLHESLRLLPSFFGVNKICTKDCEISTMKDKKIKITKGTSVHLPYYSIQHDERYFSNPQEFNPDRFSPENGGVKKFKDNGTFLTFGEGPRICVGMKLAVVQSKVCITEIIRNWKVSVNPKTDQSFVAQPNQFLYIPKGGIWLDFERIK